MKQHWRGLKIKTLWVLIVLGTVYSGLFYRQRPLTGVDEVDGLISVVLGLYICSHPAANLVDMLFFRRSGERPFLSRRSAVLWLALNMMVLVVGWVVIFLGTTRLVGRGD